MDRGTRLVALAGMALAVVVGLVRSKAWTSVHILWTDRDLWRADRFWIDWPTTGAELSFGDGARVPGGAWYAWLAVARGLGADGAELYEQLLLADVVCAVALGVAAWRAIGPVAAAVAMLLYASPADVRNAMNAVWNPTGLPVLLAGAHLCLAEALRAPAGRAAWVGWGLLVSLAAQLHMTGLAWLGWGLVSLVAVDRAAARAALAPIGAGALIAWAPHLIDELVHGFPNTYALTHQTPIAAVAAGRVGELNITELSASFLVLRPSTLPALDLAVSLCVAWFAALGLAGAWRADGDRFVRALTLPALAITLTPGLSATVIFEDRYVLAALPAWALIAGYGAQQLGRVAVVAVLVAAVSPTIALRQMRSVLSGDPHDSRGNWPSRKLDDVLHAMLDAEHPRLSDLAGRTAFLDATPDGLRMAHARSAEAFLAAEGQHFPGSLPPPCLIVVDGPVPDASALAAALSVPVVEVLDEAAIPWGRESDVHVVRYRPGDATLCHTSMYNRYIDGPVEAELRALRPAPGQTLTLDGPDGAVRKVGAAHLETGEYLPVIWYALADLHVQPGRLRGTVYVPQLGGQSFNTGWYLTGMAEDLRLVLDGPGHVEIPLADTIVGPTGVVSPFRFDAAVPGGAWTLSIVGRPWVSPDTSADWPSWTRWTEDVHLALGDLTLQPDSAAP